MYLWIKFVHVLSATILFGTGIGTACVMVYGHHSRQVNIIAAITRYVSFADCLFTAPSGAIQLVTGLWMVHLAGYSYSTLWIWGALVGYSIAAICWFIVVYLQIKMRDFALVAERTQTKLPKRYYQYYRYWFFLGWPAFISLIVVIYLMTNKPV